MQNDIDITVFEMSACGRQTDISCQKAIAEDTKRKIVEEKAQRRSINSKGKWLYTGQDSQKKNYLSCYNVHQTIKNMFRAINVIYNKTKILDGGKHMAQGRTRLA